MCVSAINMRVWVKHMFLRLVYFRISEEAQFEAHGLRLIVQIEGKKR